MSVRRSSSMAYHTCYTFRALKKTGFSTVGVIAAPPVQHQLFLLQSLPGASSPIRNCLVVLTLRMAVRVGFDPTEPAKVQRFSRPPDPTTLGPQQASCVVT